jgi:hypothetical protein
MESAVKKATAIFPMKGFRLSQLQYNQSSRPAKKITVAMRGATRLKSKRRPGDRSVFLLQAPRPLDWWLWFLTGLAKRQLHLMAQPKRFGRWLALPKRMGNAV